MTTAEVWGCHPELVEGTRGYAKLSLLRGARCCWSSRVIFLKSLFCWAMGRFQLVTLWLG